MCSVGHLTTLYCRGDVASGVGMINELTVKRRSMAKHGRSNKLQKNKTFSRVSTHITGV
jgi:hypothetical protein